ncbi:hypothetical protein BDA96_06G118600 [Sorghum bicolor]|uniref:DUF4283 domain-containing protein n=2 Tax=Sorghum bicolor TaxID=4558 RepID=A0A921QQT5_SORBI|nr:hypothetical protein BDA96_06G118600 [Sorghum bicolor]OQU81711.1 hypothetical protein SORBI_3006G107332 [Sorghum bicolor]
MDRSPSPGLNPFAAPFSPVVHAERLSFSDSEASFASASSGPPVHATAGDPAGAACGRRRRTRRRRRRRRQRVMAGLEAPPPVVPLQAARLRSVVVHPARLSAEPDAEGFREVHSRRRWRRRPSPVPARPVPPDLIGLCFNCLSDSHVKADYRFPSRYRTCRAEGHRARFCPLGPPPLAGAKRGRSPAFARGPDRGALRRREFAELRRASRDDTISACSVSTGRSPSVPRCCAASPGASGSADAVGIRRSVAGDDRAGPSSPGGARRDLGLSDAAREPSPAERPRLQVWRDRRRQLSEVDRPSVEVIVVPRSAEIQAAENALSFALVAMLGGTRPPVSPAAVREHLCQRFQFGEADVSVCRHAPEDFLARFARSEDLERVLAAPPLSFAPFLLSWRRWTRLSQAVAASFTYRVLVGIKGIPAHARSKAVAEQLLGSSCAQVELASSDDDGVDDDDAPWCLHPMLVPEQKLLVIPEPPEPHEPGILFLREHEIIHSHLPILHYLVRLRVVEYQDWAVSSSSSEDAFSGGDSDDSGDSSYNGYHPGTVGPSRSRPFGPATFRPGGAGGPALGRGSGPAFRQRRREAPSLAGALRAADLSSMIDEGRISLGGRAWSWCGSRLFGATVHYNKGRRSGLTSPARPEAQGTPARCVMRAQAVDVDFGACYRDSTATALRFDSDPMLLEECLAVHADAKQPSLHCSSPDLWPSRQAQLDGPCGFIGRAFDASPTIRGSGPACQRSREATPSGGYFDAMEMECRASAISVLPAEDVLPAQPLCAAVAEELEARICLPIRTPVLRSGPRLRCSRTPRSARSVRRSGRIAAKPRVANSTKQAQSVLLKKLGIQVDDAAVDSEIQRKFKETINGDMSVRKQRALQVLFSGDLDPASLGVEPVGVDGNAVEA